MVPKCRINCNAASPGRAACNSCAAARLRQPSLVAVVSAPSTWERKAGPERRLDQAYATEEALDFCQRFAIPLWLWTVDDKKLMQRFIKDTRIECLITNRPDLALKLRTARS